MDRARSRRRAAGVIVGVVAATVPSVALGHSLGQTFPLPVPLGLYLAAAAVTVAVSFAVAVFVVGAPPPVPHYRTWPVGVRQARVASWLLRLLGLGWWYGAITIGFVVGDLSSLPAVMFWIFIWVGMPIAAILLGNPWPSFSPLRTTHDIVERALRPLGVARLDLGLPAPAGVGRWPATVLLLGFLWLELVYPERNEALTLAVILSAYTAVTLVGMTLIGRVAWLREVELFEILYGWFGRVGPLGRRARRASLCADCGEACDPAHCVDCPECSAAADGGDLWPEYRPWITGLTEPMQPGWSDAGFIILALAGVTYDGLKETALGANLLNFLFGPLSAAFGPIAASLLAPTITLVLTWLVFLAVFAVAVVATARLTSLTTPDLAGMAGRYGATLLPIAAGYVIAHYLTLLLQGIVWLPTLIVDPISSVAPTLDMIPIAAVWYLSVGAIVGGHVAAIVLAHRHALSDAPGRAVVSGLPLVVVMVSYTILSLWIIAQPIVVEPASLLRTTLGG